MFDQLSERLQKTFAGLVGGCRIATRASITCVLVKDCRQSDTCHQASSLACGIGKTKPIMNIGMLLLSNNLWNSILLSLKLVCLPDGHIGLISQTRCKALQKQKL